MVKKWELHDDCVGRYLNWETLESIGKVHGVSRQRVQQIVKGAGAIRGPKPTKEKVRRERPDRFMPIYGCTKSVAIALNDGEILRKRGSKASCFRSQKNSAKHRGIEWHITFSEWVELWKERWPDRGRGMNDYVMARANDMGPYAPWNVHIIPFRENLQQVYNARLGLPFNLFTSIP
jgi:hypothetical protein